MSNVDIMTDTGFVCGSRDHRHLLGRLHGPVWRRHVGTVFTLLWSYAYHAIELEKSSHVYEGRGGNST